MRSPPTLLIPGGQTRGTAPSAHRWPPLSPLPRSPRTESELPAAATRRRGGPPPRRSCAPRGPSLPRARARVAGDAAVGRPLSGVHRRDRSVAFPPCSAEGKSRRQRDGLGAGSLAREKWCGLSVRMMMSRIRFIHWVFLCCGRGEARSAPLAHAPPSVAATQQSAPRRSQGGPRWPLPRPRAKSSPGASPGETGD